jgi:hypothetical protein
MTYPWSSGEVLTAADLNAYAGLILVKTQTIGTRVVGHGHWCVLVHVPQLQNHRVRRFFDT